MIDLAFANLVPRMILGFIVFFSGWSRFQFGFPEYAQRAGVIPFAEVFLPASILFAVATVLPCIEIVLGIMLLAGLKTRQVLLILAAVVVVVTAGAGIAGLVAAVQHAPRPDGSGYFGPTGMSIIFLIGYTYPRAALILFLLLLPGTWDKFSIDNLFKSASAKRISDETARTAAIWFARVLVGLIWFVAGVNKVFIWGPIGHARSLFVVPYAHTFLPQWSLWATGTVIPVLEVVFPALVLIGLWTRPSLYVLGGILILVTFGHLLVAPISAAGLIDFILSRGVLVLVVLMFPPEADYYSMDSVLRRRRCSGSI